MDPRDSMLLFSFRRDNGKDSQRLWGRKPTVGRESERLRLQRSVGASPDFGGGGWASWEVLQPHSGVTRLRQMAPHERMLTLRYV